MDDGTSARSVWSLHGTRAKLDYGRFSGEVDVARPHMGLHHTALSHGQRSCVFFKAQRSAELATAEAAAGPSDAFGWPLPVADAYVRGDDLVASYRPIDDWPYSPQLYWQANTLASVEGSQASLSLLVSVQTHLLDTRPEISVVSRVPGSELFRLSTSETGRTRVQSVERHERLLPSRDTCCLIWRLSDLPLSYVEIMPASDFHEVTLRPDSDGAKTTEWHLFADFLEKGVLRRARIQAALLPRHNDVVLAEACCRSLERCPLPLTT